MILFGSSSWWWRWWSQSWFEKSQKLKEATTHDLFMWWSLFLVINIYFLLILIGIQILYFILFPSQNISFLIIFWFCVIFLFYSCSHDDYHPLMLLYIHSLFIFIIMFLFSLYSAPSCGIINHSLTFEQQSMWEPA